MKNFFPVSDFLHFSSSCTQWLNRQNPYWTLFPPCSRQSRCWGRHRLLALLSVFGLILLHPTAYAQTDGRFSIFLDTNRPPLTSDGLTLSTSASMQLGTFTNSTNSLDVINLIRGKTNRSEIIATLSSNFVVLFSTNRLANVVIPAATLTFPTNLTIGGTVRSNDIPAYVLLFNSTDPNSATEMGIFRARSTSTNALTNAFFPSNNIRGRTVLSDGDQTTTNNTSLKLGMGTLFGQARNGSLRLAPIGPPEQMIQTNLQAFVGLDCQIPLLANNGPSSFSVVVSNSGATSAISTLGLTNSNGVIVGLPTTNSAGTNTLVVSATNGDGFARTVVSPVSLVIRVQNGPQFTNPSLSTNTAGVPTSFNFLTDATNPAALIFSSLDSLPSGLTLSSAGVLSGTNTATGTNQFRILVTDTNTGDVRSLTFSLVTTAPKIIINGTNSSGQLELIAGRTFTNLISYTAGYTPTTITNLSGGTFVNFTFSGLNQFTGTALSTAMRTNDAPLTSTFRATNAQGVAATTQVQFVFVNPPPEFLTSNQLTWILGTTTNQLIEASGNPSFSAANLPPVATGIAANGKISITTAPGILTNLNQAVWTSTIVANNAGGSYRGGGSTTSSFVITLTNPIPLITSTNRLLLAVGKSVNYTLTASGNPSVLEFLNPQNLPAGLTANGNMIQGTPTKATNAIISNRVYNYGLPGSRSIYQPAYRNLNLFVAGSVPKAGSAVFSSPGNLIKNLSLPAGGSPFVDVSTGLTASGFGLPPGLSIDRLSGNLTGTPTATGAYSVTVFIANAKGWNKTQTTLIVKDPVIP